MGEQPGLWFGILGPLAVQRGGEPAGLSRSAVLRGLLGVLLAALGEPLTSARLGELVWPDGVRSGSVHVGISRLRRWLAGLPAGADGRGVAVAHDTRGYRLLADPAAVDLTAFRDLVARAHAATRVDHRCELLGAATRLCRGPVLADLHGLDPGDPLLRRIRGEVRDAGLALADAAVAAGRGRLAVDWIEDHVRREPLDEPAHSRLIAVLAACGRPADALARYGQLRGRLAEELGVSPSEAVQRAYLTVLAGDRAAGNLVPAR